MASRTVSTLKFVGSISLGLLTGLSYTLSTLTLPTLLTLPSATSASRAFTNLTTLSLIHLRILAGLSSSSFLLAYFLSPRNQKHPYLLWTTLFVAGSGLSDLLLRPASTKTITGAKKAQVNREKKASKGRQQMDASYEVLGEESSEVSEEDEVAHEELVNGEDVRREMESFMTSQVVRTVVAGVGFAMSVVGIWGDGAADVYVVRA